MWFSFSTFPGTKFVINGHFKHVFGCEKLQAALKTAQKFKNIEKMPFLPRFLQKQEKIRFLHSMGKKSTKVDFSPISCKKAPFYTRNGHF